MQTIRRNFTNNRIGEEKAFDDPHTIIDTSAIKEASIYDSTQIMGTDIAIMVLNTELVWGKKLYSFSNQLKPTQRQNYTLRIVSSTISLFLRTLFHSCFQRFRYKSFYIILKC